MTPSRRSKFGLVCVALLVAACSKSEPPKESTEHAQLANEAVADDAVPADVRARIDADLEALFGTFEAPRFAPLDAWKDVGFDPATDAFGRGDAAAAREAFARSAALRFGFELDRVHVGDFEGVHLPEYALDLLLRIRARAAELPREARDADARAEVERWIVGWYPTLAESASLYRVQCAKCHGARGEGDGPTSTTHDPRPRDFRGGVFKFTSRVSHAKPTRDDLRRVLVDGLPGTGMASFGGLSRAELEGSVDYVRWIAVRSGVEKELLALYELDGELADDAANEAYASVWSDWLRADSQAVPVPTPTPDATSERIARGKALFLDATKGNCVQCHGESGVGDGPASYTLEPGGAHESIKDDWGRAIRPRNLVEGKFRGGRKPEDVYRRIWAGINGTPMPALGESKDANGAPLLSEDEIWCLAFYALSLRK
ncbi:MAG: c-type cytochrome [Planctomycetes bacterium]|nr:c-type cytochrome [Planctomycetota bacterium]